MKKNRTPVFLSAIAALAIACNPWAARAQTEPTVPTEPVVPTALGLTSTGATPSTMGGVQPLGNTNGDVLATLIVRFFPILSNNMSDGPNGNAMPWIYLHCSNGLTMADHQPFYEAANGGTRGWSNVCPSLDTIFWGCCPRSPTNWNRTWPKNCTWMEPVFCSNTTNSTWWTPSLVNRTHPLPYGVYNISLDPVFDQNVNCETPADPLSETARLPWPYDPYRANPSCPESVIPPYNVTPIQMHDTITPPSKVDLRWIFDPGGEAGDQRFMQVAGLGDTTSNVFGSALPLGTQISMWEPQTQTWTTDVFTNNGAGGETNWTLNMAMPGGWGITIYIPTNYYASNSFSASSYGFTPTAPFATMFYGPPTTPSPGVNFLTAPAPCSGGIETNTGFIPVYGDKIALYRSGAWVTNTYTTSWSGGDPILQTNDCFWFISTNFPSSGPSQGLQVWVCTNLPSVIQTMGFNFATNTYNIWANQLDYDGTGTNNTSSTVFGNQLPRGSCIYTWDPSITNWLCDNYVVLHGQNTTNWEYNYPLNPGQGAQIFIPTNYCTAQTVSGTVSGYPPGGSTGVCSNYFVAAPSWQTAPSGEFLSAMYPASGSIEAITGYSPIYGDVIEQYSGGTWTPNYYTTGWSLSDPILSTNEAVFFYTTNFTSGVGSWTAWTEGWPPD